MLKPNDNNAGEGEVSIVNPYQYREAVGVSLAICHAICWVW